MQILVKNCKIQKQKYYNGFGPDDDSWWSRI